MSRRISRALVFLLLLALALNSPLLLLLASLGLLVAGASALWGRYCLAALVYGRRFSVERVFPGETLDLWVEIVNAKPLPLAWLRAEDDFPAQFAVQRQAMGRSSSANRQTLVNLLSVRGYERVRRHYQLTALRRGLHEFGPVVLSSGDLFGFRTRFLDVDSRHKVLVYPRVVPLGQLGLQPARPFGEERARRRPSDDPLRLAGARDYAPGDSLRHVHWKATARRGQLQTKVYDPGAAHCLVIFLNSDTLRQSQMAETFEAAVTAAASLAQGALDARQAVGFFTNGGSQETHHRVRLPPSRHAGQGQRLLETLAQVTYFTFLPFDRLLEIEAPALPYGASVIAVSAVASEEILAGLLELKAAGHPVALVLIGGEERLAAAPAALPVYVVSDAWQEFHAGSVRPIFTAGGQPEWQIPRRATQGVPRGSELAPGEARGDK